jgi:hypothetical protein
VRWSAPKTRALDKAIREALGLRPKPLKVTDPENGGSAEIDYDLEASYSIAAWTPDLRTP